MIFLHHPENVMLLCPLVNNFQKEKKEVDKKRRLLLWVEVDVHIDPNVHHTGDKSTPMLLQHTHSPLSVQCLVTNVNIFWHIQLHPPLFLSNGLCQVIICWYYLLKCSFTTTTALPQDFLNVIDEETLYLKS